MKPFNFIGHASLIFGLVAWVAGMAGMVTYWIEREQVEIRIAETCGTEVKSFAWKLCAESMATQFTPSETLLFLQEIAIGSGLLFCAFASILLYENRKEILQLYQEVRQKLSA